ncbi:MAG: hypothetical protein L6R41_008530 [Letrouitia leprolyta]|nr:MAG: hypothetical protein L6R41_008530 [Letrouitia leprolyta]
MSTASLNRLPTIHIFEDNRSAPPKQATFPHRRHSSSIRKPRSTTPSTRWKQQTLTQITPTLFHASSSSRSFDGVDDLEYDSLDLEMPPKKRPRKSGTPKPKPKPKPQNQTITQMDPFKQQIYPPEDVKALVEENAPEPASVSSRKKRKNTSNTPTASTVQTRASTRKSTGFGVKMEAIPSSEHRKPVISGVDAEPAPVLLDSQDLQMPPPKTPKRPIPRIIPSSQSSAETPLSTRGRGNEKNQNVTPLGERSVNTPSRSRLFSRRKSVQWAPKLVVSDSTNGESETSETFFPPIIRNQPSEKKPLSPRSPAMKCPPRQPTPPAPSSMKRSVDNLRRSPYANQRQSNRRALKRKATIADSEDENNSSNASSEKLAKSLPRSSLDVVDQSTQQVISNHQDGGSQGSELLAQSMQPEAAHETVPTQPIHRQHQKTHADGNHLTTLDQDISLIHSSDSEDVSTQLENKLLQSSSPAPALQPPTLETESQFENAWRELSPPPIDLAYEHDDEQQGESTLPAILSSSLTNLSTQPTHIPPIPPSQATTTDITQATAAHQSHLNDNNEGSQILGSSSTQYPEQFLPSSSSPFRTRKEQAAPATFMGYEGWDGVRMTDSQLLPRSYLDDSLELPPLLREEVELEMEEE